MERLEKIKEFKSFYAMKLKEYQGLLEKEDITDEERDVIKRAYDDMKKKASSLMDEQEEAVKQRKKTEILKERSEQKRIKDLALMEGITEPITKEKEIEVLGKIDSFIDDAFEFCCSMAKNNENLFTSDILLKYFEQNDINIG
eukprot:GHVP01050143.1.p1 GENE.GHVP01050143.1~~GHVP01050143.1.p1  ORF type:complete len:143 (+),score=41.14 GHVP01050143.1:341-769(+)